MREKECCWHKTVLSDDDIITLVQQRYVAKKTVAFACSSELFVGCPQVFLDVERKSDFGIAVTRWVTVLGYTVSVLNEAS